MTFGKNGDHASFYYSAYNVKSHARVLQVCGSRAASHFRTKLKLESS
jgi:hypothetical protein